MKGKVTSGGAMSEQCFRPMDPRSFKGESDAQIRMMGEGGVYIFISLGYYDGANIFGDTLEEHPSDGGLKDCSDVENIECR